MSGIAEQVGPRALDGEQHEVVVRSEGVTGVTHRSDLLPLGYLLAHRHLLGAHVVGAPVHASRYPALYSQPTAIERRTQGRPARLLNH